MVDNGIRHYIGKGLNLKPTPRQLEMLALIREGHNNKQIGFILNISEQTVKNHVREAVIRLGASDRTSAVINAIRRGYLGLYGKNIKRDKPTFDF